MNRSTSACWLPPAVQSRPPTSTARTERFVAALRGAADFDPSDKAALIRLQGEIVDPRYAATDWRTFQNFVGATVGGYREDVHFVCPRPEDVPGLMEAWMSLTRRVVESRIDPVVAAAVSSFAFVFIHPFEDGNGRIHRFLMHHVLPDEATARPASSFRSRQRFCATGGATMKPSNPSRGRRSA